MNPTVQKTLLRLLGAAVFAVGAFVGKLGLDQHAARMGGPESAWIETRAVVDRIEPNPRYPDRRQNIYTFTAPSGADMECRVGRDPDEDPPAGEAVTIWVHTQTAPGNCRLATENWDAGFTPAHFFMLFALAWMAMGAAFMIRPPRNSVSGGPGGPV